MKITIIIALCLLVGGVAKGQYVIPSDDKPYENPHYQYLLLVKEKGQYSKQIGDLMSIMIGWTTKDYLFITEKELIDFIAGYRSDYSYTIPGVSKENIIAIYDLKGAMRLVPDYKVIHIVKPKRIEIEKEEYDTTAVMLTHSSAVIKKP